LARTLGNLELHQHNYSSSIYLSEILSLPEYDMAPWKSTSPM
jgi:hypothetical protein